MHNLVMHVEVMFLSLWFAGTGAVSPLASANDKPQTTNHELKNHKLTHQPLDVRWQGAPGGPAFGGIVGQRLG